jgi:hypothetical protein
MATTRSDNNEPKLQTSAEKIAAVIKRAQEIEPEVFADGGDATLAFALMAANQGAGRIVACFALEHFERDQPFVSAKYTHIVYESQDVRTKHWDIGGSGAAEMHAKVHFAKRTPPPKLTCHPPETGVTSPVHTHQLRWFFIEKSNLGSFLKDWGVQPINPQLAAALLQDIPLPAGDRLSDMLAKVDAANGIGRCHSTMPYRDPHYREVATRFLPPHVSDWLTRHDALDQSPMTTAIENGDLTAIKQLLAAGFAINLPDEDYCVALHTAALSGDPEICKLLLEAGADPNLFHGGRTSLHEAALWGCTEACRVLIKGGAKINPLPADPEPDYLTPLQLVVSEGEASYPVDEVIRAFGNEFGADLYATTLDGRTLDELAMKPHTADALRHGRLSVATTDAIEDALGVTPADDMQRQRVRLKPSCSPSL